MKLFSLNTKSSYSLLNSLLSVENIIAQALLNKQESVSLIDDNVLYGAIEFYDLALANNLKPILGIEFEFANAKIVLIAKNYLGFQIIMKISSLIMMNKTVQLADFLSDDLFIIRTKGDFFINHPNFYTNDPDFKNFVAVHEARYKKPEDYKFLKVVNAIANENKLESNKIQNFYDTEFCYLNDQEIRDKFLEHGCNNLEKIINDCNLLIPKNDINILEYAKKEHQNSAELLKELCYNGLKSRGISSDNELYWQRLEYELDVIITKGFADYFLIVQDFISYARSQNILVGPGRGSAAGSLVSYSLKITQIDPIKYDLFFERFLNPERQSMPDIDIDIMDTKRDLVIDYIFQKYGEDHVGHIITFSTIKAKMAIRDVGRVFGIPVQIVDKIAKSISNEFDLNILAAVKSNPNLQNYYLQFKELFDCANQIIGLPRQISTHAAGVVISNKKLVEIVPIQTGLNDHNMVQYSMNFLEELGLIKIDLLGLKNLTILDSIVKLIAFRYDKIIDLAKIDYDDKKVFEMLASGQTTGVFQLESPGMRKMIKKIQPQSIEDISITSAIFRPGASAHADQFILNKQKNIIPEFMSKEVTQILAPTYGVIIYQEQIIQLVQAVAKFDAQKADMFRRAISKKSSQEIIELKNEFINSAITNGYTSPQAEEFFGFMLDFASYGFNHSHSLAYSFISYQLAYLKYHYPTETICVLLSLGDTSPEKLSLYLAEAQSRSINIKLPDINLSNTSFVIDKNDIYFSFTSIFGFGLEKSKKIVNLRNQQPNQKFKDAISAIVILFNNGISIKLLESLIKVGAFDDFKISRAYLLFNLETLCDSKRNMIDENGKFLFDLNLQQPPSESVKLYGVWEQELLGISLSQTKHIFKNGEEINCRLDKIRQVTTKNKRLMYRLSVCFQEENLTLLSFDTKAVLALGDNFPKQIKGTVRIYEESGNIVLNNISEVK